MSQDPDERKPSTSSGSSGGWGRREWWGSRDREKAEDSVEGASTEAIGPSESDKESDSDSSMDPLGDIVPAATENDVSVEMILPEIIEEEEGVAEDTGEPAAGGSSGPGLIHPGLLPKRSIFDESEPEAEEEPWRLPAKIGPGFSMPVRIADMVFPDPVPCIARPRTREQESTEGEERSEESGGDPSTEEDFEIVSDVVIPIVDLVDVSAESDDSVVVVHEGVWHRRSGRLARQEGGGWARQGEMEWHGYF